jgi:PAS domain S-box-containing protein
MRSMSSPGRESGPLDTQVLVDSIPALIHTASPDGYLDYFNKPWLEYLGVTLDKVAGWNWTSFIHPEDVDGFVVEWRACLVSGETFEYESRVRRADGQYRWMIHRKVPLRDTNGNIVKWYGSSLDIEERKTERETKLQENAAKLEEAQRVAHVGYWEWDLRTDHVIWSDETYRIYGLHPQERPIELATIRESIHPEDREFVFRKAAEAARGEGRADAEHRIVRPKGEIRVVHSQGDLKRDAAGLPWQMFGTIQDITDRKLAEDKIREQEAGLRQILDLAPQHIAVYGPNREPLYANRILLDYCGLTLEMWRQRLNRSGVAHPDEWERVNRHFDRALASGAAFELEMRLRKSDGSYRWFLARYNPLHDEEGQITRWYVTGTDIEDRKQAEDRLRRENVALREEIDKASMFEEIVGTSAALKSVLSRVSKVAPSDSTVLITGETGTGKELVARAIHRISDRASRAFVSVNCAAIPRDLIASELFGHEKGAFTGATQQRLGRFELANGGTLFLDEVGELPSETQIALLRVLQEHEFERVGGTRRIRADVRVIAATNRDLQTAIISGSFRSDLFYRLNVFPIEIPSLRERREDIPMLVEYFIDRYARKASKRIKRINKKTLELLQSYAWPGNIRELQNVIERSMILCETEIFSIDENWLPPLTLESKQQVGLRRRFLLQEKDMIETALKDTRGRVSGPAGAAVKLGMPRSTMESKIRSLRINKNRFKS